MSCELRRGGVEAWKVGRAYLPDSINLTKDKKLILSEFSKFLQSKEQEIIEKNSCTSLLGIWVKSVLERHPKTHVEKIIHKEITLAENKVGDYLLVAKSESGRTLTNSLYNFAMSYEQHMLRKWLIDKKASDFKE